MPISDYAHHNEEAQRIWWEEEGRHESEPPDYDPEFDDDRYCDYLCAHGFEDSDDCPECKKEAEF